MSVNFPFALGCLALSFLLSSCSVPEQPGSFQQSYQTKSAVEKTVEVSGIKEPQSIESEAISLLRNGIEAQRQAGYPDYNPRYAYVVVPSHQRMTVLSMATLEPVLSIPVGTGKNGLGFGGAQTPIGFFTMGGVRIAKDASAYIQTGDSKSGVSGVYAEMLYPAKSSKLKPTRSSAEQCDYSWIQSFCVINASRSSPQKDDRPNSLHDRVPGSQYGGSSHAGSLPDRKCWEI